MKYSKIYKFVKGQGEQERIYKVLEENYQLIQEHYVFGQGISCEGSGNQPRKFGNPAWDLPRGT